MTVDHPKALWAELRRGSAFLLVPEQAWRSLQWSGASADEKPVWDEVAGAWLTGSHTAEALAAAAQTLSTDSFERTTTHFEGPGASGTATAGALTPHAAARLREELVTFLRLGPFSWRFVDV